MWNNNLNSFDIVCKRKIAFENSKTNFYSMYFVDERNLRKVSNFSLLSRYLMNYSNKYKSIREKSIIEEMFYGSVIHFGTISFRDKLIFEAKLLTPDFRKLDDEALQSDVLEYYFDSILNPMSSDRSFHEEYFEIERQKLIEEIEIENRNSVKYAQLSCIKHTIENDDISCDLMGEVKELKVINSRDVYKSYESLLSKPVISYINGNVENQISVNKKISFSKNNIVTHRDDTKYITEQRDDLQSVLAISYSTSINFMDEDTISATVFNSILGGSSNSILFEKIREKLNLCYFINTFYDKYKNMMLLLVGYSDSNHDLLYENIKKEISNAKNEMVTKERLDIAKKELKIRYRSVVEYQNNYSDYLLSGDIFSKDLSIDRKLMEIDRVRMDDVIKAANTFKEHTVFRLKGIKNE